MNIKNFDALKSLLDHKVEQYNRPDFIVHDPICIPHSFYKKQDVEISAFWVAMMAWGKRSTIISKSKELFALMDNSPHDFILNHEPKDLINFLKFKHRTFQPEDTLYFIAFFKEYYTKHTSLEEAFAKNISPTDPTIEQGLCGFYKLFFALEEAPQRTRKHVSTPARNSACKRLCMFLRWMVRNDNRGVDFGLWQNIKPSQLICPCDVHVVHVAQQLGWMKDSKTDWIKAVELTDILKKFDSQDPVKYDFALFGMGIEGYFKGI